jgi:hypothetical protein
LTALELVSGQQHIFHRCGVLTRGSNPFQDGVFLVPFDARQTANAASFRYQR